MALIKCHECGKEVSSEADACPNCGVKPNKDGVISPKKATPGQWIGITAAIIFVFWILTDSSKHKVVESEAVAQEPTTEAVQPTNEPMMQVSAKELAQAYDKNSVSADAQYKDRRYEVTGIVSEISTDMMGNAVIAMKGGVNEFLEPQFILSDSAKSQAGQIGKGQNVTLVCIGAGDVIKMAQSKDCLFK